MPIREPTDPYRSRVLRVDLDALARGATPRVGPYVSADPVSDRIASWGGSALCAVLLDEAASETATAPLVLAAGECVRRGLPTAARASVGSRGALSGSLAEGQVGGDLALRLASIADAVIVTGRAGGETTALVLDAEGSARLVELGCDPDADPEAVRRAVVERCGPCAVLRTGPAGRAGVPFATLVAGDEHPSHVGRGGLGVSLTEHGLVALAVTASPDDLVPDTDAQELVQLLASSPRLRARGEGGTFELWQAFQARGDLTARNYSEPVTADAADALWRETREAGRERVGCRGCPTPCGWVFERSGGARQGAHFGASWALGPNLGLERFDDSLHLLGICDTLGLDAKEAGAVLALRARAAELGRGARGPRYGDLASLEDALREIPRAGIAEGARGALRLARELGLEHELATASGQAAREESDLASVLGQCTSANGSDPMRSFAFSTADGLDRERIGDLLAGVPLPEGIEDPHDPRGKGRLVWWHENLVAAIDATGFCAFSAGGLLADGACDLDGLAEWIAPRGLLGAEWEGRGPGERLLAAGASIALLRRRLNARWRGAEELPAWARDRLLLPGMLDEYRGARGVGPDGLPTAEALALLGTPALLELGLGSISSPPSRVRRRPAGERGERSPGTVGVRGTGPLSARLRGAEALELMLPAAVRDVLSELARARPSACDSLLRDGRPLVAVHRDGARLGPDVLVRDGDELVLVVAISGG